jgi:hypothetical protein
MKKIIDELNESNGANYKLGVLKKYQDNELLKRILKMTYCKVSYTYGVTTKNVKWPEEHKGERSLESALDVLEYDLATRQVTGNAAILFIETILAQLSEDDAWLFAKILDRDLKINMGRSQINKVHKNLIVKPPYMRCGLYNEKTQKKISYPAYCQIKADGAYRAVTVAGDEVTFTARSGEESYFPLMEEEFKQLKDGVYIGEVLIRDISNRAESNGMLNSDNPPHKDIYMQLWDYVPLDEYNRPKDKKRKTKYSTRFKTLRDQLIDRDFKHIELIESRIVQNLTMALRYVSGWMKEGLEGGILKDANNIFIDHTSPTQLKLKLEIDADVRCTGFYEGKRGTKRVHTFGGMTYTTDDGKVQGRTSGFTDAQLVDFNGRREELIGEVFTIQFNDITKARDSDTYALSHPRFIEFRPDKTETDTLERILEMKEMAMEVDSGIDPKQ